jgi:hypothetical protein
MKKKIVYFFILLFFFVKGDREQFNQCQTQLETLYDNGCSRTHLNEFLIYRLLYSLLLNDYKSKIERFRVIFISIVCI